MMPAKTTLVSSASQLVAAAKKAGAGDTILLAPGNYGDVSFSSINPVGTVTIRSAETDNDAVLKSLKLTRSSNFIFADIDIVRPLLPGEPDWAKAASVSLSKNISFVGVDFSGSLNGNHFDDGNGLSISTSSQIKVLDSTFQQFNNALIVGNVTDIVVAGNTFRDAREGVQMAGVNNGLFEKNFLTAIVGDASKGDHSDAFQVQSANGVASSDLVFRSNVIVTESQGIFIKSETLSQGVFHSNIVIENNYYEGMRRNAISVSGTDGFIIEGNTVREGQGIGLVPAITIGRGASHGQIVNNIAPLLLRGANDTTEDVNWSNNIDLWDSKTLKGISVLSVFSEAQFSRDIDFSRLNATVGTQADVAGIGFESVEGIGNLNGAYQDVLAHYVQQLDTSFAATLFI